MNVVFIAKECYPFACASSLATLVCTLAKAVEKFGHNVKVIIPRYGYIEPQSFYIERLPLESNITLFKGIIPNSLVSVFFVDSQNHFSNSKEIYLEAQNLENEKRDEFFSLNSLDTILKLNFEPDIIHIFNPSTSYVVKLLHSKKIEYAKLSKMKTVFTIYNLMELSPNLLKITNEAINYSDLITTPSTAYANELITYNLDLKDTLLKKKSFYLGIPSSIDEDLYDPETDSLISQGYSKQYFSIGKRKCKEDLVSKLSLEKGLQTPLFAIVLTLNEIKELDDLTRVLPQLSNLNLQLIFLCGTKEHDFIKQAEKYENIKVCTASDNSILRKIYAGSDFLISTSKTTTSGLSILSAMKYGCVPIVNFACAAKDIVIDIEEGENANGITFNLHKAENLIEALTKAINLYKNKERWPFIVKQCMSKDMPWHIPAKEMAKKYIECYEKITNDVKINAR